MCAPCVGCDKGRNLKVHPCWLGTAQEARAACLHFLCSLLFTAPGFKTCTSPSLTLALLGRFPAGRAWRRRCCAAGGWAAARPCCSARCCLRRPAGSCRPWVFRLKYYDPKTLKQPKTLTCFLWPPPSGPNLAQALLRSGRLGGSSAMLLRAVLSAQAGRVSQALGVRSGVEMRAAHLDARRAARRRGCRRPDRPGWVISSRALDVRRSHRLPGASTQPLSVHLSALDSGLYLDRHLMRRSS